MFVYATLCVRDVDLVNVDLALDLLYLFLGELWQGDGQYAVVHLGCDVVLLNVVGENVGLLVVGVAELAAQEVFLLVLLLVFQFVLDGYFQIAIRIDVDSAKFLFDAWHGQLHAVGFGIFFDIDSGCGCLHSRHPIVVEEVVEHSREPVVCIQNR